MILSICIAAYNQIEILRKNIEGMLRYTGNDVEFLVSDDCSSDDVRGLVKSFHDERLKYCRTIVNGGHDKNIINALRHASGEFVMVLRSRDSVKADSIQIIVKTLQHNRDVSYAVFSAIDDEGKPKLSLRDKRYASGRAAIAAHGRLFVHPSGNIYRSGLLDLDMLERVINVSFTHKFGFTVHELIRMELACRGDFLTSSQYVWIYANTVKQSDVAVNSVGDGRSVYNPELNYERHACELCFVNSHLNASEHEKYLLNRHIVWSFQKRITRDFAKSNSSVEMQRHYGYKMIEFSPKEERHRYRNTVFKMLEELHVPHLKTLKVLMYVDSTCLALLYPLKDMLYDRVISR